MSGADALAVAAVVPSSAYSGLTNTLCSFENEIDWWIENAALTQRNPPRCQGTSAGDDVGDKVKRRDDKNLPTYM